MVDVIVTDVQMPGHSGLDVLRDIRRTEWSTPVIVISGFGDASTCCAAHRLGAAAVFHKPLDVDALRALTGADAR